MAASAGDGRRTRDVGESRERTLTSVLEARVAHLRSNTMRAEKDLDDAGVPDGAAEFAAAAAQHEVARRALDRLD